MPRAPALPPGEYVALPPEPASAAELVQVATQNNWVFTFGGQTPSGGQSDLASDGAVYDTARHEWSKVAPWPYDDPPWYPGIDAVDGQFLVLATPCPTPFTGDEDHAVCGRGLRAASYDVDHRRWTRVEVPDFAGIAEPTPSGLVRGLGVVARRAVFDVRSGDTRLLATYDLDTKRWRAVSPPDGWAIQVHDARSEDDGDPHANDSNAVCAAGGRVVAARLDTVDQVARAWTLESDLTWRPLSDLAIVGGTVGPVLDCAGTELLLVQPAYRRLAPGESDVAKLHYLDVESRSWQELPVPPLTKGLDLGMAAIRTNGTWLLWPDERASDSVLHLAAGATSWSSTPRPPVQGPVNLDAAEGAILVDARDSRRGVQLGLYGPPN